MAIDWLSHITAEIGRREDEEVKPFKAIFHAYMEAIHREEALMDEIDTSREHQANTEAQLKDVSLQLSQYKNGTVDERKYAELSAKYERLKEEQTVLYRTQSSHVQRLLDLNEQIKSRDQTNARLHSDLDQAHAEQAQLKLSMEHLQSLIEEKNLNIQIMQDELTALQLELLHTDEKMTRLEEENHGLVSRWMAKVSETAEMLNQQIDIDAEPRMTTTNAHYPSQNVEGKKELVNSLVLEPQSDQFAICTSYPYVRTYSLPSGEKTRNMMGGPKTGIISGRFNPAGDIFVGTTTSTGSAHPCVHVWSVPSEKIRGYLGGHDGVVTGVAFLPGDDTKIVTCSHDHTIRIFDLPRSLCLKTVETKTAVNAVLTGDKGIMTAHQDGTICRWDERTGTLQSISHNLHSRAIMSMVQVPDSNEIITMSLDHSLKSVDLRSLCATQTFRHENLRVPSEGSCPALSPDGKLLAAGSSSGELFIWNRVWNSQVETVLNGHNASIVSTLWSKGSLVSADRTGTIKVWK